MSLGFNIKPGWGNTVYADAAKWQRALTVVNADLVRFPWVNNAATIAALQWCADHSVDVLIEDPSLSYPVARLVSEIAATGLPVAAIEGINEPDLYLAGDWLSQVRARQPELYAAVNGRWPVACPPLSTIAQKDDLLMAALPCDIVAVHRYAPYGQVAPNPVDFSIPKVDKPVWVTETGYPTFKKWVLFRQTWVVSPAQQAQWLPASIDMLRGAARVVCYQLLDSSTDITNKTGNMGAFDHDGNPKPVVSRLGG